MHVSDPKRIPNRKKPWMLRVSINGTVSRRFFTSYQEASIYREEVEDAADKVGGKNLVLDADAVRDYRTALSLVPNGHTLTEVVVEWLKSGQNTFNGITFNDALKEYWQHLRDRELAKGTYGSYWHCHQNVLAQFGERTVATDIASELEQWFLDLINKQGYAWRTAKRHKAYLDGFYGWAIKKRYTPDNWCRFVTFARETKLEKVFLTVEETTTLLRTAEEHDPAAINWIVLGLFSMPRPRLERSIPAGMSSSCPTPSSSG